MHKIKTFIKIVLTFTLIIIFAYSSVIFLSNQIKLNETYNENIQQEFLKDSTRISNKVNYAQNQVDSLKISFFEANKKIDSLTVLYFNTQDSTIKANIAKQAIQLEVEYIMKREKVSKILKKLHKELENHLKNEIEYERNKY